MAFTNILENLITAGMWSRQWDSNVFSDAEEAGNWGNWPNRVKTTFSVSLCTINNCEIFGTAAAGANTKLLMTYSQLLLFLRICELLKQHCFD